MIRQAAVAALERAIATVDVTRKLIEAFTFITRATLRLHRTGSTPLPMLRKTEFFADLPNVVSKDNVAIKSGMTVYFLRWAAGADDPALCGGMPGSPEANNPEGWRIWSFPVKDFEVDTIEGVRYVEVRENELDRFIPQELWVSRLEMLNYARLRTSAELNFLTREIIKEKERIYDR